MSETATQNRPFKQYQGNLIEKVLMTKAANTDDPKAFMAEKIGEMETALNRTKRLAAVINNTYPPELPELVIIADILGVTIDELIKAG